MHFLVPFVVAMLWRRQRWQKTYLLLMATMLIDLDHLLANPIYDPNRCSIGFHPLHHPLMFIIYGAMLAFPITRVVSVGLLIHMMLDGLDCVI